MENESIEPLNSPDVINLLSEDPEDLFEEREESPDLDPSDFSEFEESEDANPEDEDPEDPEDPESELDPEEEIEDHRYTQEELSEKGKEMRKEFMQVMKPSTIIGFADMILSRGGSAAMVKTDRKDWRLDPEEKEWLALCLDCMIEEERIEFWPAKVWLILGVVVFYGLKGMDNYTKYYTAKGIEMHRPEIEIKTTSESIAKEYAELEVLQDKAALEEKRAKVMSRIARAMKAQEEGVSLEELNAVKENHRPTFVQKAKKDIEKKFPPERYPPDQYEYVEGILQFGKGGKPKKRRGRKKDNVPFRHPVTGFFCNEEEYNQAMRDLNYTNGQSSDEVEDAEIVHTA